MSDVKHPNQPKQIIPKILYIIFNHHIKSPGVPNMMMTVSNKDRKFIKYTSNSDIPR